MKKFAKITSLAVAGLMCVTIFAACGDKNVEEPTDSPEPIQTTQSTPMPAETPTPPPTPSPSPTPTPEPTATPEPEASASASSSASSSGGPLKLKDENAEVTKVQERLEELGYLDKVTGYYGTDTESAVKKFQQKNDLDADGIVGSGTKKVLFSEDAKKAS